jgi:hypothetical protein
MIVAIPTVSISKNRFGEIAVLVSRRGVASTRCMMNRRTTPILPLHLILTENYGEGAVPDAIGAIPNDQQ